MSVLQHIVSAVDTIQSIATQYFGDASRWRDIVDFNNLDYPYVTTDPNFSTESYASGDLLVQRQYATQALTVPAGTLFAVPIVDGTPSRIFQSTQTITIQAGYTTAYIPVQCTIAGYWGNVTQNAINLIITADSTLQSAFSLITNPSPFTNGDVHNVKRIGEALLIPLTATDGATPSYNSLDDYYAQMFGKDLELGDDGDLLFDSYGDIGSVSGTDNLAQAVRDRLLTPKKSLPYHPEYGSMLDQYVASAAIGYADQMIALTVQETLLDDDRIYQAVVTGVQSLGTTKNVTVSITPINQGDTATLTFSIPTPTN